MRTTNIIIILAHAFLGWALCAAIMGISMAVTSLSNALIIHAVAAPVFFAGISLVYFRKYNYTAPLQTAFIFIAFVIGMDFFAVALLINRSLGMFTSLLGTWIPLALIFTSTWLTGTRITKSHQAVVGISKGKPFSHIRLIPLIIILTTAVILLLMLLSGGMTKVLAWYLLQMFLPVTGLIGVIFSIVRMFVRKRVDRIVTVTGFTSLLAIVPALMLVFPLPYPASLEHTSPSATVRLPADVPLKVAWGGDILKVNQHVIVPDQRWAYDFLVEPYLTGSSVLTDYGCFGVPVVAPASGFVSTAHDGEPDMVPGIASNNYKAPTGNHVIIKLDETGTYLEIAHLKQGSVTVTSGQHVEEGQVIGQCGNSGNTSEPHIHIHHQRQDPSVYPINFAEGLPLFFRDLDGPPMPEGGLVIINGTPVASGATVVYRKIP